MSFVNFVKNIKLWKVIIVSFAGASTLLVQLYLYPNAGKKIENKRYEYSFQTNFWTNTVLSKLKEIRDSDVYSRISITQPRTLTQEYLNDVMLYESQIQDVVRVLKYQSDTLINLQSDFKPLVYSVFPLIDIEHSRKIAKNVQKLLETLHTQQKIAVEISQFLPKLKNAFDEVQVDKLSDKEKIDVEVNRLKIIIELFSKKELMMRVDSNSLKFLVDFGVVEQSLYKDYDFLVEKYNAEVEREDAIKKAILLSIALLSAWILLSKEHSKIRSYDAI